MSDWQIILKEGSQSIIIDITKQQNLILHLYWYIRNHIQQEKEQD